MQFELVEVLFLLGSLDFPLDDDLSGGIPVDETVVNCVQDRTLDLVVEVHDSLPFMAQGVVIGQFLVGYPGDVADPEIRTELPDPLLAHAVLLEGDIPDCAFLVDGDPLAEVFPEQIIP